MSNLYHLIYTSRATQAFDEAQLAELLRRARDNNARLDISGMLLYADESFFQILEGAPEALDALFAQISKDPRHGQVTTILREPIVQRSFADWTMGSAQMSAREIGFISGLNDFFSDGSCLAQLNSGRAKKLLAAFKEGRWRAKLGGAHQGGQSRLRPALPKAPRYSFAFQPIVNADSRSVVSYEALIRGLNDEPAWQIFQQVGPEELHPFDETSRAVAIGLAARLGLSTDLNLNFLPLSLDKSPTAVTSTLEAAERLGISPSRITLEIDEDERISDHTHFARLIEPHRSSGFKVAIDNFGAGHAGLSLLDQYQPDLIALNMNLIRHIDGNGPRQAIFRGIAQTCGDLGIDILIKGVETLGEYQFLRSEGIRLFQGQWIAAPTFERLGGVELPAET